jgi:hypothetical protein
MRSRQEAVARVDIEEFLTALGVLLADFQQDERSTDPGKDRSVAYGNLRYQVWANGANTSIGIIYETPGGSTNQINIEFRADSSDFCVPSVAGAGEFVSADRSEILSVVEAHVRDVPHKRMEKLHAYIDSWVEEGRSRREVFERLNQLNYQDLKGGRITHEELAQACHYVVSQLDPLEDPPSHHAVT